MTDSRTNVKVDGFAMEWTHAGATSIMYICIYCIFCYIYSVINSRIIASSCSLRDTIAMRQQKDRWCDDVTKFEERRCVVIRQANVFKEERTKTRKKRKTNNTWSCRSEIYNAIGLRRYAVTRTAAIYSSSSCDRITP